MAKFIIVGNDLHEQNMVLKVACDQEDPETLHYTNDVEGREALFRELHRRQKQRHAKRVVIVYEASSAGFHFYDEATDEGFECHVIAPSLLKSSPKQRRRKTDERDALRLFEHLRAHLLAGNELYSVWIPDPATRNDRELVRGRMDVGIKLSTVKGQVQMLIKRVHVRRPDNAHDWNDLFCDWLNGLSEDGKSPLVSGAKLLLASYLRQIRSMEDEKAKLDLAVEELAQTERYRAQVKALTELDGVAVFTAMVFLTEMGDLSRFSNRREIAAYLGLVPSSDESGLADDRKGHITHQGSWRLRRSLCQSAWVCVQYDEQERAAFGRIQGQRGKKDERKKIALVAVMRRLAIKMWHIALEHQPELPTAAEAAKRRAMHAGWQTKRRKNRQRAVPPQPAAQ